MANDSQDYNLSRRSSISNKTLPQWGLRVFTNTQACPFSGVLTFLEFFDSCSNITIDLQHPSFAPCHKNGSPFTSKLENS